MNDGRRERIRVQRWVGDKMWVKKTGHFARQVSEKCQGGSQKKKIALGIGKRKKNYLLMTIAWCPCLLRKKQCGHSGKKREYNQCLTIKKKEEAANRKCVLFCRTKSANLRLLLRASIRPIFRPWAESTVMPLRGLDILVMSSRRPS